jgi:hypothetical protein
MDDATPQGSSRGGRGKKQSGGKPQGEPVPAGREPSDDEPAVPGDGDGTDDAVDKVDEGQYGGGASEPQTPAAPADPKSKVSSDLLRFERRGHRRRR